jgi:hypothetical protein
MSTSPGSTTSPHPDPHQGTVDRAVVGIDWELGTVELTVELPETGVGHLTRLLRAIARDELTPFPARFHVRSS